MNIVGHKQEYKDFTGRPVRSGPKRVLTRSTDKYKLWHYKYITFKIKKRHLWQQIERN